jgi:two-component system phosphate regulon sensor histidine kinase PhoR
MGTAERGIELLDLVATGIVEVDGELVVGSANVAAHLFADRAPGTMVGLSVIEAFVDRRVEEVVRSAVTGGWATGEIELRPPDGPSVIVRARRAGAGAWVLIDDVSELRRLQRIRTEFVGNLSHELRTPLTTVSLLAEALSMEADADPDRIPARMRDRIEKIRIETEHLAQIVSELLELSRIESGGPIAMTDEVDMAKLARATADRLHLFAERQSVRLSVEAPSDLPRPFGDEDRLGQVLVNLVHNAIKFSPDGGAVRIAIRRVADEIVTSVEDHGIGIAPADQPRVFERFFKADRARVRGGGGTGLGLAIARHIVAAHGGRIWLTSTEGAGSVVTFALPLRTRDRTTEPG